MTRGIMRALIVILFLFVTGAFAMSQAQTPQEITISSAVPRMVQFSGTLKDVNGRPMSGVFGVTFAIYADQEGGAALWMETQSVTADGQGKYSVVLGSQSNGIPDFVFGTAQGRWLGVQPAQQPEMPRVLLVSVPYALKAGDANTLGGLPPSAFLLAGAVATQTASSNTSTSPLAPTPATTSDVTTTGATADYLPLWTGATTVLDSVLFQSGTEIGINNKAPAATLDVTGSGIFRGFLQLPATGTATTSAGFDSQPLDLLASAWNTSGTPAAVAQRFRWQSEPVGSGTATTSGKLNLLFASGTNAPAETGLSISSKGIFTFASGQAFPGTGAGTITGVTAGTDLTGGGKTGAVTLNLDTTKVPTLDSANTFTGNQTITGNVTASGAINGGTANFTGAVTTGAQTVKGNISETGNITSTGSISGVVGGFDGTNTTQIFNVVQSGTGAAILGTSSINGVGVAGGGFIGILGHGLSSAGAAGQFQSNVGGPILTGLNKSGTSVFSVDGNGNLTANSFNSTTPVSFTDSATSGIALLGQATAGTGNAIGTEGDAHSASGVGVMGKNFFAGDAIYGSAGNGGTGVQGDGVIGVLGRSIFSKAGPGVEGISSNVGAPGGQFQNTGGGNILAGLNSGAQVFTVTNSGGMILNGSVGMGLSTPQASLNIDFGGTATSDSLLVGNNTTKGLQLRDTGGAVDLESIGVPLWVNNITAEPVYLSPSGAAPVAIGTSAPGIGDELTVVASARESVAIYADAPGNGPAISANSAANDAIIATNDSSNNTTLGISNNTTSGSSYLFYAYAPNVAGNPKCTIDTSANLVCSGSKSAAVPVDGGSRMVALYAEESAENWFSDYGTGRLVNGEATIQLDPTYAQTVETGIDYHVFLTPNGDCRGLYIAQKSPSSFVVRELNGGRSTLSFDYRIVAKRKGYEQIRLADKTAMMAAVNANAAAIADRQKASAAPVQSRPSRTVIASKPQHPQP